MRTKTRQLGACFVAALFGAPVGACKKDSDDKPQASARKAEAKPATPKSDDVPATAAWSWDVPKGLGTPPVVPDDNPMTQAKVELGHRLFMDKRLSTDGSRSCYSCHLNEHGNADGRATAIGPGDTPLPRNTPTIWNVAYLPALYWDGRAANLEAQAIGALKGGNMALGDTLAAKASEIGALPEYRAAFEEAFGLESNAEVTPDHIAKALAAYERTLLCGDTAYDRQQLSDAERRGWALFSGKAGCISCHNGPNFTDGLFHATGIGIDPKEPEADIGRGGVEGHEGDKWKFRTPTLRNVAQTAPYFHNGSVTTLREAVALMAGGGQQGVAQPDKLLLDRNLSADEIDDLVSFLQALDCPGKLEVL